MRIRILAASLVLVSLMLAQPLLSYAFVTDSGFRIETAPTLVVGMEMHKIVGPEDITAFRVVPGQKAALFGGTGYFALVNLEGGPSVGWAWSFIGSASWITYDDSYSPNWYVAGSNTGEVLAVNAKNPDFRVSYFSAGRQPVTRVGVGLGEEGKSILYFTDQDGYLYIYKLPEASWMEIGPAPHDGPIGNIPGFLVLNASFAEQYRESGDVFYDASRLAVLVEDAPPANVSAVVYVQFENGTRKLAQPGTIVLEDKNITIKNELYFGPIIAPYNVLLELQESDNASITLITYPTLQSLFVAYMVSYYNLESGEPINSTCYAGSLGAFEPAPGSSIYLGRIVVENRGTSLQECISSMGVTFIEGVAVHPMLAVRASTLPKPSPYLSSSGDAWVVLLEYPEELPSPTTAHLWRLFSYDNPNPDWPAGATSLLVTGVTRYLYIYVMNDLLYPLETGSTYKYVEVVDVGSDPTCLATDRNGTSIFAGTLGGSIVWLRWNPSLSRYVAVASLQVDNEPVTSVSYLPEGYLLVSTASGRLQLVKLVSGRMIPMWRGPYEYDGIETGVRFVRAGAINENLIVAAAPGAGEPVFYTLMGLAADVVRVEFTVKTSLATITGSAQEQEEEGGYLEVYDSRGNLVAMVSGEEGYRVYLTAGTYTFEFYVPGLGYVSKTATVQFPDYKDTINLGFREVKVQAIVPPPGEGQRYPEGVEPGPLQDALVTATPVAVDPALGLDLEVMPVTGVTGKDGSVILRLWDGVVYNITVKKTGFENYTTTIPAWGPITVTAKLPPIQVEEETPQVMIRYYDIRITVVNDQNKPLASAYITIENAQGQVVFSGYTDPTGQLLARLPQGTYTIKATADGYHGSELPLTVPGLQEITIQLEPTTATKVKRILPYILLLVGLIVLIVALFMLRERIAKRLAEEEEYF